MKKILLALVVISVTISGFSQDVKYGVRGALNISNLDFKPDANFENEHRNGFAFGGFVDYGFSDTISVLAELQWSAEGGKDEDLRADYLQVPVQLRFSLSDRLTIGAGPQVALKTWKSRDGFSTFAISGLAGVEYMITDELFIDARVTYGFTNILDEDQVGLEAKNHVIQFGFGIKI